MATMPEQKPGRSEQTVGTPWAFIRAVEHRFGPLSLDLAATFENKKAPSYIGDGVDSLAYHWAEACPSGNLWLNPPFGKIEPWAQKCFEESRKRRGLILFLTPASVGSQWYSRWVHGKAFVLALNPRLTFEGHDSVYPKDLILSVYGIGLPGFDVWKWA